MKTVEKFNKDKKIDSGEECTVNNLKIQHGWFVHFEHDLYGGLNYYGIFESEEEAMKFSKSKLDKTYDEINILYLPYVIYDGYHVALWDESACKLKN